MEKKVLYKLLLSIVVCLFIGFLTGFIPVLFFLSPSNGTLKKSIFSLPTSCYPLIWTMLYVTMGYAFGLIWSAEHPDKKTVKKAMLLFGFQLLLNILWGIMFFIFRNRLFCAIENFVLIYFVFQTIIIFRKIDPLASKILYPYFAWLCYSAFLITSLWWNNRYLV